MSSPKEDAQPAPLPADVRDALIRQLREELIKTQMIVLELNDRILEKETDRTDAIAILGRVELVLEQKIDYIVELDQALNARIRELQSDLTAARELDRQRLAEQARVVEERDREYAARDAIIRDHANRLDAANQEIGRAHNLAGGFARDLSHTRDALAAESASLQSTRAQLATTTESLAATQADLAASGADLVELRAQLAEISRQAAETSTALSATADQLAAERRTVATIKASALWRLGRPWRALFGPKA